MTPDRLDYLEGDDALCEPSCRAVHIKELAAEVRQQAAELTDFRKLLADTINAESRANGEIDTLNEELTRLRAELEDSRDCIHVQMMTIAERDAELIRLRHGVENINLSDAAKYAKSQANVTHLRSILSDAGRMVGEMKHLDGQSKVDALVKLAAKLKEGK